MFVDGGAMNTPATYQIVIAGHATKRILGVLQDDFAIDTTTAGITRLSGEVRDPSHLHGVVSHLTSLAIEIISVTPVGSGNPEEANP